MKLLVDTGALLALAIRRDRHHAAAIRFLKSMPHARFVLTSLGLVELATHRFAKPIHDVHALTTRTIARFLVTGQGTTEAERNFVARLGFLAARNGLCLTTLTRSYLLWRDINLRILNEEIRRLRIAVAASELARMIIRSSADTGILRMARAYDAIDLHVAALPAVLVAASPKQLTASAV